jgi:hypothetical protein
MLLSSDSVALTIDGGECAGEFEQLDIDMPRLTYGELTDTGVLRFLGPAGFQVTVIGPSGRIRALVDGGTAVRHLTITMDGQSITHPVQFHKEWTAGGVIKVFGCLARDRDSEPQWVATAPSALVER